jgi:hypothetical protein
LLVHYRARPACQPRFSPAIVPFPAVSSGRGAAKPEAPKRRALAIVLLTGLAIQGKRGKFSENPKGCPPGHAVLSERIVVARVSFSSPGKSASSLAPRRAFWPASLSLCLSTLTHPRYVLQLLSIASMLLPSSPSSYSFALPCRSSAQQALFCWRCSCCSPNLPAQSLSSSVHSQSPPRNSY